MRNADGTYKQQLCSASVFTFVDHEYLKILSTEEIPGAEGLHRVKLHSSSFWDEFPDGQNWVVVVACTKAGNFFMREGFGHGSMKRFQFIRDVCATIGQLASGETERSLQNRNVSDLPSFEIHLSSVFPRDLCNLILVYCWYMCYDETYK
jgi:hypothetical protein